MFNRQILGYTIVRQSNLVNLVQLVSMNFMATRCHLQVAIESLLCPNVCWALFEPYIRPKIARKRNWYMVHGTWGSVPQGNIPPVNSWQSQQLTNLKLEMASVAARIWVCHGKWWAFWVPFYHFGHNRILMLDAQHQVEAVEFAIKSLALMRRDATWQTKSELNSRSKASIEIDILHQIVGIFD